MDTIYNSLRQELVCPFLCERELIKDPVVLQNCGHIFCFECVKGWLKSRKRTCPVCRTKIKEVVIEQDKIGANTAPVLQANPQLKTVFGLIEILLSQAKLTPGQNKEDADLVRSLRQLQIETSNLKMQRKLIEERANIVQSSSEDEDEDITADPTVDDQDYEAPRDEYAFNTSPPISNNNTPLRKSLRKNKN